MTDAETVPATPGGETQSVASADGTVLTFDRDGDGPPLVLVGGAFNTRAATAPLAASLRDRCTTLNLDRRGRGDSGDTAPYAVDRELDDLDAVIAAAGGTAAAFGYSSGATLVLRAAARGSALTRLVLYDAPLAVGDDPPLLPRGLADELAEMVRDGRRGDAVERYQRAAVGLPEALVARLRHAPSRPALEAIAHTLSYDARVVGDVPLPTELLRSVTAPTLVLVGELSPPVMHTATDALVRALPDARRHTVAGQGHELAPDALRAVVLDFLA